MAKTVRIQIEVSEELAARMAKVKEVCGLETQRELFANAFSVFAWAVNESGKGNSVSSLDPEHKTVSILKTPALDHAHYVKAKIPSPSEETKKLLASPDNEKSKRD